jgi:hypothetical protein
VVNLTYGASPIKTMRLYLRQGEGSDYVMYDQAISVANSTVDPGFNHPAGTKRPYTMRISPDNLTDPLGRATADWNTTSPLSVGSGNFVAFPSQAGYHFQYATSTRAFHPSAPITISNWNSTFTAWTSPPWIAANSETCPTGYRRIKELDGGASTNSNVATSEVRQSFYLAPGNSQDIQSNPTGLTWGYYADGYFDRRAIEIRGTTLGTSVQPTAVSWGTPQTAFVGAVLYNPTTYSHLFLPLPGIRESSLTGSAGGNGEIIRTGVWGYYISSSWSDTSIGGTAGLLARSFRIQGNWGTNTSTIGVEGSPRARGFSIRCVRF